ncbi:MAG: YfiR family protein [Rhodoferax sp.]|nr:YfiR family protein [Rhodoferax sp.]MCF8211420.1 YfiR family protein [Rhodoferax sp.]
MRTGASRPPAAPVASLWQWGWHQVRAVLLCFVCMGTATHLHAEEMTEYQVKAAFLYNFAVFTEWPPGTASTLNLCLVGHDPFGTAMDELQGKSFGTYTLKVHRKKGLDSLGSCQIVFVASADIEHLPRVLGSVSGLPVLTIADTPGAIAQGVAINLRVARGHVQFDLNLPSLRRAGLGIGSGVLRLAVEVIR